MTNGMMMNNYFNMNEKPRMVNFRSTVNKIVGVRLPEYGVNMRWENKGQVFPIPFSIVEQMLWHTGFRNMIERGILYIDDMQDKIDLHLEDPDTKQPEKIIALSDIEIKNMLTSQPTTVFKTEVNKLNMTQCNNIVRYAIDNEIVDVDKSEILRQKTGIDILKEISRKKENERLDRIEEEKERRKKGEID